MGFCISEWLNGGSILVDKEAVGISGIMKVTAALCPNKQSIDGSGMCELVKTIVRNVLLSSVTSGATNPRVVNELSAEFAYCH